MVVNLLLMVSVGCIENKGSVNITEDVEDSAQQNDTNTDTNTDTSADDTQETAEPIERVAKSLVIIWDGTRPDALAKANTPNMDALINGTWHSDYQGAYSPLAQNLHDANTVSGPNHSTIMTGASGSQHGVTSNGDVWEGDFETYPHYLQRLEALNSDLNTACLFTWTTDALIPSGADYILDSDDAENVLRAVGMIDSTFEAEGWSRGTNLDALFLFLDDSDHAGHAHGFEMGVDEYNAQLEELDNQMGTILSAIKARDTFDEESWKIVFTSDHGGYHYNHSGSNASEHTIPFLIVGRDVEQGSLPLNTSILDVVPTILSHHDVQIPNELTGTIRGNQTAAIPTSPPTLIRYYAFDGDLTDASDASIPAVVGEESDYDPVVHGSSGKFGGYVSIDDLGGGTNNASYLTLGTGADIQFGPEQSYTVTMWFRGDGIQSGDPVIIANKNWNSGANPGWLLSANEGGENSFGTNFASSSTSRVDVEDIDYISDEWWFLATVVEPGDLTMLYAGNAEGIRWIAHQYPEAADLNSGLPLNIGQDGTGSYAHNLSGDIDDLAIWNRALTFEEILAIYAGGTGLTAGDFLVED